MRKLIRPWMQPTRVVVFSFGVLIIIGTILLMLPISSKTGETTPFINALFTSTSAVCVTGLVVVDTGTYWSTFGQLVILGLIQAGGLGTMTIVTLFALLMGRKISLRERLTIQEAYNQYSMEGIVRLVREIMGITAIIEGTGAIVLILRFMRDMPPLKAAYYGIFHAVSAFNNAGFDLMGDFKSLTGYVDDFTVNLTVMLLIIIGGIGFTVIVDVLRQKKFKKLTLHSKLVITMTVFLILAGAGSFFLLEYNNPGTMKPLDMSGKVLASLFQSVTPRTAGFNTISEADMTIASKFITIILMFIGASPGGTGGGIKTSTFGVILFTVLSIIDGRDDTELYQKRIPQFVVYRSLGIIFISMCVIIGTTLVLSIVQQSDFITELFESTSAFGTVGLSLGLTTELTTVGKAFIIFNMYAGRVGPLSLALAIGQRRKNIRGYKYPEEKIIVG
ncbi:MAG: TrkH family potassium uptake protein [Thermoanaerobacteraceae bacterium]|nr:TrkH family potassium uptake protein [Thermoanaerobacteraceae bacterium]